jgi:Arginase family
MQRPIILDIDNSVGALPGRLVLPLEAWQESLRFGCSLRAMDRFRVALDATLPRDYGTVFTGSGDFHHLTWPLVERMATKGPFQVVVFDNHPDNMRFPFGVHCGSWVRKVAMLPYVTHVHVIGITSGDIGRAHAWENYLRPLFGKKLTYWCTEVDVGWASRIGLQRAFRRFDSTAVLVSAFAEEQRAAPKPTYLSIDKDVFDKSVAQTNWDQGKLGEAGAFTIIDSLRGGIIGSDITGEISRYRYRSWWKRRLSAMDGQEEIPEAQLAEWQAQQHGLNIRLLEAIDANS